ncbi:MAG: ATP-binding cassette domain-containing protein, partial [Candidatus Woesearchaeota archaeon]
FKYGKKIKINSPKDAAFHGIGLIPEERKTQGIIPEMSVKENITITILDKINKLGFFDNEKEKNIANKLVDDLNIKTSGLDQHSKNLSGGNQQKVVLAKWFAKNGDILIFDEPTRGIDVGAKLEIYNLMNEFAGQKKGVIMISSEIEEVLNMSDRILVIDEGKLLTELSPSEASKEKIMQHIIGKKEVSE